ncbi:uncharacterized protein LOC135825851 [Sycon ciliatum]|uniref:uncharacterized protein LOC135825851 n=1 Tax=Sycon ciliatum TaxID=27933 RepID=UPI0031F6031E
MEVLVLGAGYGTRLQRDIEQDESGKYSGLIGCPKPLLPIGGRPLVSYWLDQLKECQHQVTGTSIVTNSAHADRYRAWAASTADASTVDIIDDGTTTNEGRLGAIADIELVIQKRGLTGDLLVIGGDTLFHDDFRLSRFLDEYLDLQTRWGDELGAFAEVYTCPEEDVSRRGIVEVDADNVVTSFLEKPRPTETQSRLACPCFYIFSSKALPLISAFLLELKDRPLAERDAPGNFLPYLSARLKVIVSRVSGRFDVGNLPTYRACDDYFTSRNSTT